MDVRIMDLYTVPTWKMGEIRLPVSFLSTMSCYKVATMLQSWRALSDTLIEM